MSTWEAFNFQLIVKTEAVTRHVRVVLVKNSSGVPGVVDAHPPTAKSLVLWMRILHRQSPHPPTASPWYCGCASTNSKSLALSMCILQWQSLWRWGCASSNGKECISNKKGARAKERKIILDKTLQRKGGRQPVVAKTSVPSSAELKTKGYREKH